MAGFHIKKVIAKSDTKETADVTFQPGLNIIQGRSNTGKTCIVKCIEFVFGCDIKNLKSPFKESSGYNEAIVVLGTEQGDITISRKVGKNQVNVSTNVEGIEVGINDLKYSKNGNKPVLNATMLKIMGIDGEPEVPSNERFEKAHLTWNNLLRLFYVKEGRIDDEHSIIEPQDNYEKTLFMSSLLYILSGRDFSETDAQTRKDIKKARKEAVESYVNKKLASASERREKLTNDLSIFAGINVEKQIEEMVSSLRKTEREIDSALEESKVLLSSIMEQEEKSAECNVLLSRYQHLRSQYKADIQRLSFIVEGEVEINKLPPVTSCPFCDGKITPHSHKSYVDTSKAELTRIMAQMEGLNITESEMRTQQGVISQQLEALRARRTEIESLISQKLKPEADMLTEAIKGYRAYIQISNEMELVAAYARDWRGDLDELASQELDESEKIKYRPKEYFDRDFQTSLSNNAESILEECNYHNLTAARFNMTSFDIEVNGEKKATSHGKGYRSYLNTVVALMFRKHLMEHAKYNPELLIVDTPLHGFDEEIAEDAPDSMRTGLYTYFMNHSEGQLIIIENLDHIPTLAYEAGGANVITFTKKPDEGRYGFLNDVF